MEQGHKPDEYITLEQMQRCDAMMDALVEYLAAS
jgi:acetylornithine deacetylase